MALRIFITSIKVDILLVEEIMGKSLSLCGYLKALIIGWEFIENYSCINLGGFLSRWKEYFRLINSFSSLLTEMEFQSLDKVFSILNIYGTYEGKVPFWSNIFNLPNPNATKYDYGGDINFTIS